MECSATDLIGQYTGHTGPKTIKQLERGLGKVLFVDEAYRLGQGHFAQEAIDELVDNITKPRFAGKMVIILAGYDKDMNNLLRVNEGLSSRFADEILFPSLRPEDCLQLLENKLRESQINFLSLQDPSIYQQLLEPIAEMSKLPSWGNARDVQTLAKGMVRAVYQTNTTKVNQLLLPAGIALSCIYSMLAERCARAKVTPSSRPSFSGPVQSQGGTQSIPPTSSGTSTATKTAAPAPKGKDKTPKASEPQQNPDIGRDAGVSDVIWQQLQKNKREAELQIKQAAQEIEEQEEAHRLAKEAEEKAKKQAARLREIQAEKEANALDFLRLRKEAQIQEMEARAERERIHREWERRKREEEERRKKDEIAQSKSREGYPEEENTWEPLSAVLYLRRMIDFFHTEHPDKPTATSPPIDTAAAQKIKEQEEAHRLAKEAEEKAEEEAARLRQIQAENDAKALELLRLREEAQIQEMKARAERERIHREWERKKKEKEELRKRNQIIQSRLRETGVCVQGFPWIKMDGGYRCGGGSHWVDNSRLGI